MRMEDELSHVMADVDYQQIPPIQQKRIITFVNHFVTNTVSYLNNFCQSCESQFMEFEYKMQKIEASLLILEAQLSSIPGFEKHQTSMQDAVSTDSSTTPLNTTLGSTEVSNQVEPVQVSSPENVPESQSRIEVEQKAPSGPKASEDPRFARFFKLVRVGANVDAVRLKMQSEGVDPSILDNPDAIIPDSEEKS